MGIEQRGPWQSVTAYGERRDEADTLCRVAWEAWADHVLGPVSSVTV